MQAHRQLFLRSTLHFGFALLIAVGVLAAPRTAWASKTFPAQLRTVLALTQDPPCTLCHTSNDGGTGTVKTPFGRSVLAAGASAGDRDALSLAIQDMARRGVDSDRDGVADIEELKTGSDPNVPDSGVGGAAGENGAGGLAGEAGVAAGLDEGLTPKTGCALSERGQRSRAVLGLCAAGAWLIGRRRRAFGRRAAQLGVVALVAAQAQPATAAEPLSGQPLAARGDAVPAERPGASGAWLAAPLLDQQLGSFGVFGGLLMPAADHNLHAAGRAPQALDMAAPTFGVRVGVLPITYAGLEGEGAFAPTHSADAGRVMLWQLRAHLIGQLPNGRLAPFLVVGTGRLRVLGSSLGDDNDPVVYFGLGTKLALDRAFSLRFDLRDLLSQQAGASDGTLTHSPEILLGLCLILRSPARWRALEGP